jgi:DNA-directed RNA polymerase delta subunit
MINIEYTHTSRSSHSAKSFTFTGEDGMVIEQRIPNQARQIIRYAYELSQQQPTFTYNDLVAYIDEHHEGTFTNSKHGTMAIVRYYSKLLQDAGVITPA